MLSSLGLRAIEIDVRTRGDDGQMGVGLEIVEVGVADVAAADEADAHGKRRFFGHRIEETDFFQRGVEWCEEK